MLGASADALAEPYVPPAGLGAPGRRESAGTRGCGFGNPANLIALLPPENIGLTTTAYPTFYWYMPTSQAQFVEFTLTATGSKDDAIAPLYSTRFTVTGEAGIARLQLPEMASLPSLEAGIRYRWQVKIFCNPESVDGDLQIAGWVQYEPPTEGLRTALAAASASDRVTLYAYNGYWFDTVNQLANLPAGATKDPGWQARWAELLTSVDLNHVIGQPFIAP